MLHTGYQLFLLNSYRIGDLSQVYPLARGVAPLIVAGISVILLGINLSQFELAAIVTIGTGIMSLTLARRSDGMRNVRAASLAIITGGFIAAYSLVDGLGARQAGTALGFYSWLSIINASYNYENHPAGACKESGLSELAAGVERWFCIVYCLCACYLGVYVGTHRPGCRIERDKHHICAAAWCLCA